MLTLTQDDCRFFEKAAQSRFVEEVLIIPQAGHA
jgi:hypothetical protein